MPTVSVIMPVHNGLRFAPAAISSILTQTFGDLELIIVDDCSDRQTQDILRAVTDERVVYLRNEVQRGVSESLNRALTCARGGLIARMDADDVSESHRLKRQVEFMARNPNVVLCGSEACKIDASGKQLVTIRRSSSDLEIRFELLTGNPFIHPSVIIRKDALYAAGGYNTHLSCAQDYDLWCRLSRLGQMANLRVPLIRYRVHSDSISTNRRPEQMQVTREIGRRHLLEVGVASSEEDARIFQFFSTLGSGDPATRPSPESWVKYSEMVEKFFAECELTSSEAAEAENRCRLRLRWRFLNRAAAHHWLTPTALRYIQLARRLDRKGLGFRATAARAVRRIVGARRSQAACASTADPPTPLPVTE